MSDPNPATLWGRAVVEELVGAGVETVCVTPGSRSTPLTMACVEAPELTVHSHLDERSSAFFAVGHARQTGQPTALVCTSGTAAANFHPAVIEADAGRVPLVVLTADRPPELRDSGANQTIDQVDLYGDAVRYHADLPLPEADERTLRSVRRTVDIAVTAADTDPAGPVHLNCPFRKPLEPTALEGSIPATFETTTASAGRDGAFVETTVGDRRLSAGERARIRGRIEAADRPLVVAGPTSPGWAGQQIVASFAEAIDAPLLADPLSGCRFGPHVPEAPICGGYDAYIPAMPAPDLVVRVGDAPTSKRLRHWLRDASAQQVLLDSALTWREATFTATDLVVADPAALLQDLEPAMGGREKWRAQFEAAERRHWSLWEAARGTDGKPPMEGAVVAAAIQEAPPDTTLTISNSMPVRDADRFGKPRETPLSVVANRGASGIDGVTSTGLGAGCAAAGESVLVLGDLAFYHDANGLAAIDRCNLEPTIVVVDNAGGGIFHALPIEDFDPPFTEHFKTPHDIDLPALCQPYDVPAETVDSSDFADSYRDTVTSDGPQVLIVEVDAADSHRRREQLSEDLITDLRDEGPN